MMTLEDAVRASDFDADCLLKTFRANHIVTFNDLENAPVLMGARLCGYDIYTLIHTIGLIIKSGSLGDELNLPISEKQKAALKMAGLTTMDQVVDATIEELAEIKFIGQKTAEKIKASTVQGENYDRAD